MTTNFIGERYGRLVVTGRLGLYAQCVCDCGNRTTPRMDKLREGKTKSCGCYAKDLADASRKPTPARARATKARPDPDARRLSAVYSAMWQRCSNPNCKSWKWYGARGVVVCDAWRDKAAFLEWAKPLYRKGLWLERVDNAGPYSPDNCVFASPKAQGRNRSNTLWVAAPGAPRPLAEVAAFHGIPYQTAYLLYCRVAKTGVQPSVDVFRRISRRADVNLTK